MPPLFPLDFQRSFPDLLLSADFRTKPDDFFVDEQLGFELSGTGEHLCLHVEKCNQNTVWVAKQLAELAGIKQMDIGYCGLKDKHAITRQWFSLYLGQREIDWRSIHLENCTVLAAVKHDKKLRRGSHAKNTFRIRLRHVKSGSVDNSEALLRQRWQDICEQGVPNYFGEQRFGYDGSNLQQAQALLTAHAKVWREHKHQFAVSALRSYLFNHVLADRVRTAEWRHVLDGDPQGIATGPLWGRGRSPSTATLSGREKTLLEPYAAFCEKLEHLGLQQERRSLLLQLTDASIQFDDADCILVFSLPPGAYATSVLREFIALENIQHQQTQ